MARLPIREVVFRLRVKSEGNENVKTGLDEKGDGGAIVIGDWNRSRDIVRETGSRAKDDMG